MQARPRLVQVERRDGEIRAVGEVYPGVRRIVVSRVDPLRPLVLTVPALAALRAAYPRAWLGLLVRSSTSGFARLVKGVDQVLTAPPDPAGLPTLLREFQPDLLVSMTAGGRIPWAATTARVPHRVGPAGRVYSPLFERRAEVGKRGGRDPHEVEQALALAQRAGAKAGAATFPVALPDSSVALAREWLEEHRVEPPFAVLRNESCGAGPSWPAGHFNRLATLLAAEGVRVVFSVGPGDATTSASLDSADVRIRKAPRFTGDLPTLAAFLRSAALVVGNSTGAVHLTAALGPPVLMLQAPWRGCSPERWGPYAPQGWSIVADARGADRWSSRERSRLGPDLMATISPASVLSCCLAMLEGREPRL